MTRKRTTREIKEGKLVFQENDVQCIYRICVKLLIEKQRKEILDSKVACRAKVDMGLRLRLL